VGDRSFSGSLEVLWVTLILAVYLFVIGVAVRAALARLVRLPTSAGLTVGLGIVPTALGVAAARVAHVPVRPAPWIVLGIAVVVLVGAYAIARHSEPGTAWSWLREQGPTKFDAAALVAGIVVLSPVISLGLTYWTTGTNDFPSYVSSAQVWLSGPNDAHWLHAHPDAFGALKLRRAGYEKPMCTAILVAASVVTHKPPYLLLGPIMALAVVLLISGMFVLATRVQRRALAAGGAVLAPVLSLIPMSRVFDAQLGQVLALPALVICLCALLAQTVIQSRWRETAPGVLLGALITVTVGMSVTLMLGIGLTVLAVAAWLLIKTGFRWRPALIRLGWAAATTAVLSIPFIHGYRISFSHQTSGDVGFNVPLASPLGLVGLQARLMAPPSHLQASIEWLAVIVVASVAYLGAKHLRPGMPISGMLAAVAVANAIVLLGRYGADSYNFHKWLAVAIPLTMPPLLLAAAGRMPQRLHGSFDTILTGLGTIALIVTFHAATAVPAVVPNALWSLAGPSCPRNVSTLNIDTGSFFEDSMAPLVACTPVVVVPGRTNADSATPAGNIMLMHADQATALGATTVTPLEGPYVLATIDLEMPLGTTVFGTGNPTSARYLYGSWQQPEQGGIWSKSARSQIVFDLPKELRGETLQITLNGRRAAVLNAPRSLTVKVDGQTVATARYVGSPNNDDISFQVDATMVHDGRLAIQLNTPSPIVLAKYGQLDTRTLGYYLHTLTIAAAPN